MYLTHISIFQIIFNVGLNLNCTKLINIQCKIVFFPHLIMQRRNEGKKPSMMYLKQNFLHHCFKVIKKMLNNKHHNS
ncbi:hypothetical protein AQUCO_07500043v1 [Aquilegia coerulea]|uniref:Uncharacterized protein n=1 Tax=Aquilegia coerulea TaxID=218851 RepID=A0A2G5CAH3_AQUCA|nr:hypothetical protein AQUCO_07500043v1 [Aquilegia coerulea]